jgi:hypothetical protein
MPFCIAPSHLQPPTPSADADGSAIALQTLRPAPARAQSTDGPQAHALPAADILAEARPAELPRYFRPRPAVAEAFVQPVLVARTGLTVEESDAKAQGFRYVPNLALRNAIAAYAEHKGSWNHVIDPVTLDTVDRPVQFLSQVSASGLPDSSAIQDPNTYEMDMLLALAPCRAYTTNLFAIAPVELAPNFAIMDMLREAAAQAPLTQQERSTLLATCITAGETLNRQVKQPSVQPTPSTASARVPARPSAERLVAGFAILLVGGVGIGAVQFALRPGLRGVPKPKMPKVDFPFALTAGFDYVCSPAYTAGKSAATLQADTSVLVTDSWNLQGCARNAIVCANITYNDRGCVTAGGNVTSGYPFTHALIGNALFEACLARQNRCLAQYNAPRQQAAAAMATYRTHQLDLTILNVVSGSAAAATLALSAAVIALGYRRRDRTTLEGA